MQKSFCAPVMFTVFLVAANAAPVKAECQYLKPFREAGKHHFTVHGAFNDLVVKTALHEFVKEHLPNSSFMNIGNQDFNLQDIFIALSDACAEIVDAQFMGDEANYNTIVRHALVGHLAHKVWVAFLDVVGVSQRISDDVKKQYRKFGKAWFSKAFAIGIDTMIAQLQN